MLKDFPFVEVKDEDQRIVGPPDAGTRVYRRTGALGESAGWYDYICEHISPRNVSPGGVSMYGPVSRAGVHTKLKRGQLTAFCFHLAESRRTLFGYEKVLKRRPFIYIPVSECKAWAAELAARPGRQMEEAEGDGDSRGEFLDRDPKDAGNRRVKYVED
jgi:hypothetical protein